MRKILKRAALFGLIGLGILGGPAAQENQAEDPHATGLIPLDSGQIERIVVNWPRITRVGINRLGFERVNEVRAEKGKAPLDPLLIKPVGGEVEGAPGLLGAAAQPAAANENLAGDMPVSVDNSQLRYFPPIRDQGLLGACTSFATTYTQMSYMTAFQRNLDIRDPADNTNKYSPKWTYNMVNGGGDSGSTFTDNYELLEKHGAATWDEFPYDNDFRSWCLNPAAWRNALGVRTKHTQYVSPASTDAGLEQVKELLTDGYVLVFGTYIGSWSFKTITDDVSTSADDPAVGKAVGYWLSGRLGSHAMTIVGYNDAIWTDVNSNGFVDPGEKGAFRIASSWGTGWGDAGFTWLAYDALGSSSKVFEGPSDDRVEAFQGDMVFVLTARNNYSPLMIAEFTVSHAKRNQVGLRPALSDTSRTYPTTWWTPAAFQRQGGAYAFDGSSTAMSGTFDVDFSDILVAGAGPQRYYLTLDDNTEGDPATLSAFKIVDLTTDPPTEVASSFVPQTADHETMFPYVEYSYAGPDHNDPPQISSVQLFPPSGRPGDLFRFGVHYFDPDRDVPSVKTVVIDGTPQPMALAPGEQPANGQYEFEGELPAGAHSFYYYFEDGRGESVRAPLAGAENGPYVYSHLISSLSPGLTLAGGPSFILTVNGSDLPSGSVVTWEGSDRPTTFVSSSRLDAEIGAGDLVPGRMVAITVWDPAGGYGNDWSFEVSNPMPVLASLSPPGTTGGGPGIDLTLHGSGFVSNSSARWNGVAKSTTYVSAGELRISLSALDLGTGGNNWVSVVNSPPNGGISRESLCPVSDFAISKSDPNLTCLAGQTVRCTVQATARNGSFDSAISFSCSGLPRGCRASFSPATVIPGAFSATTTLSIVTTSRSSSMGAAGLGTTGFVPPALGMILFLALIIALAIHALFSKATPVSAVIRRLATAFLILLMVWLAGCGAGGKVDTPDPGTPAGTYQVGIQATSGSLTVQSSLTLIVN